jgi:hypothetical protein
MCDSGVRRKPYSGCGVIGHLQLGQHLLHVPSSCTRGATQQLALRSPGCCARSLCRQYGEIRIRWSQDGAPFPGATQRLGQAVQARPTNEPGVDEFTAPATNRLRGGQHLARADRPLDVTAVDLIVRDGAVLANNVQDRRLNLAWAPDRFGSKMRRVRVGSAGSRHHCPANGRHQRLETEALGYAYAPSRWQQASSLAQSLSSRFVDP